MTCLILLFIAANAYAVPVTVIQQPTLANPEIVNLSSGNTMTIRLSAGNKLIKAALIDADANVNDIFDSDILSSGNESYVAGFKADIKPGLYDFKVTVKSESGEIADIQPRSVWIIASAPDVIKFAYISDSHVGDPRASMSKSTIKPKERRLKIFTEAASSGAQFVIMTGDIVSVPGDYKNEYKEAYQEILDDIKIPVFIAPGNHDLYTTSDKNPKQDGAVFWNDYFGSLYYAFRIGNYLFVSIDTYDWPKPFRNFMNQPLMNKMGSYAEGAMGIKQFEWLKAQLSAADKSGFTIICLAHHSPLNGFANIDKKITPELVPAADVLSLLERYRVKYYLSGHIHSNTERVVGSIDFMTVTSASAQIPDDSSWGYKICSIAERNIKCDFVPVVEQIK